nr:MAG TPA: hypothetical protein [Bacteriophage sp.]
MIYTAPPTAATQWAGLVTDNLVYLPICYNYRVAGFVTLRPPQNTLKFMATPRKRAF